MSTREPVGVGDLGCLVLVSLSILLVTRLVEGEWW
jgi:hypothetical protein